VPFACVPADRLDGDAQVTGCLRGREHHGRISRDSHSWVSIGSPSVCMFAAVVLPARAAVRCDATLGRAERLTLAHEHARPALLTLSVIAPVEDGANTPLLVAYLIRQRGPGIVLNVRPAKPTPRLLNFTLVFCDQLADGFEMPLDRHTSVNTLVALGRAEVSVDTHARVERRPARPAGSERSSAAHFAKTLNGAESLVPPRRADRLVATPTAG
jgi:hypothetical protein